MADLPSDILIPMPGYNPDLPDTPFDSTEVSELKLDWKYELWNSGYSDDWVSTRKAAYLLGNFSNPTDSFTNPLRCIKNNSNSSELIETKTKIRSGNYSNNLCVKYVDLAPRNYVPVSFYLADPGSSTLNLIQGYITVGGRRVSKIYSKLSNYLTLYGVEFRYNDVDYVSSSGDHSLTPVEVIAYIYYSDGTVERCTSVKIRNTTTSHFVEADKIDTRYSWHHGRGIVYMPIFNTTITEIKVAIHFRIDSTTVLDPDYSQCYLVKYYSTDGNAIDLSTRKSPFANWTYRGNFGIYNATNGGFWKFYENSMPEKIEDRAFYGLTNLHYFPFEIYKLSSDGKSQTLQANTITSIGAYAFAGSGIYRFLIPEAIKTLGEGCCANCSSLQTVNYSGNKITIIPIKCFYNCSSLISDGLPNKVTEILYSAYEGCVNYDFPVLTSPSIIGANAFKKCKHSASNVVANSNLQTGGFVFSEVVFTNKTVNCMPIASIQWKMADYYKASFVEDATINIVEGTTNIPYAMFANGSASYTSAGTYDHVLKVNFPKSLKTLEGSAFFKRNIVNTDFSATSLESIGESCFAYNYLWDTVILPSTCKKILKEAFLSNNLKSINFPKSLETIGDSAFYNNSSLNLQHVWIYASNIGSKVFCIPGSNKQAGTCHIWLPNITILQSELFWGRGIIECHVGPKCTKVWGPVINKYISPNRQWFFYSSTSTMGGNRKDYQLGRRSGADFNLISGALQNYVKNEAWAWYLNSNHTHTFDPYLNHTFYYYVKHPTENKYIKVAAYNPKWYRLDYEVIPMSQMSIIKFNLDFVVVDSSGLGTLYTLNTSKTQITFSNVRYCSELNGKTYKLSNTWYWSHSDGMLQITGINAPSVATNNMDPFTFLGYFYNLMTEV